MAAKKRMKKQTLSEFRAWLEGVEEIQESDWTPSQPQWKMIRARILNIAEAKPEPVVITQLSPPEPTVPNHHPMNSRRASVSDVVPVIPQVPSSFDMAGVTPDQIGIDRMGIPPESSIAKPGPAGVPKSGPPTASDGSSFE